MNGKRIISRKAAMARGLKRYFTGHACCNGHVTERNVSDRHCVDCNRVRQRLPHYRAYHRRYDKTPKGRECVHRKNTSPAGRERMRRYDQSPKGKEKHRRSNNDLKGRERMRRYDQSPKGRERAWRYSNSPKGRGYRLQYQRTEKYQKQHLDRQRLRRLNEALDLAREFPSEQNQTRAARLLAKWNASH